MNSNVSPYMILHSEIHNHATRNRNKLVLPVTRKSHTQAAFLFQGISRVEFSQKKPEPRQNFTPSDRKFSQLFNGMKFHFQNFGQKTLQPKMQEVL